MDVVRINRSKLVGKNKSKSAVIQALIRANALNRSGNINYNEYGKLDGIGFEKVSEKFVDNFIFKVLVHRGRRNSLFFCSKNVWLELLNTQTRLI